MFSGEEERSRPAPSSNKKRRRPNACDACRTRKIKCDGRQSDTGKCTNCKSCNWDCTLMMESSKKYATGYIEALKTKIEKLEKLVKRLAPNQDFTAEVGFTLTQSNWMSPGVLGGPQTIASSTLLRPRSPNMPSTSALPHPPASVVSQQTPPAASLPDEGQASDDEETSLQSKLWYLPNNSKVYTESNYFGRSSWYGVLSKAFTLCTEVCPDVDFMSWQRTAHNWKIPSWTGTHGNRTCFEFPEPTLMDELVDLYFSNVNILSPVLHRPTFEASRARGLHLENRAFAGTVLLVCAIGSRLSTNRDVLLEGESTWYSAGWKWYTQAPIFDTTLLNISNGHLYHLQMACLAGIYITGVSAFYAWIFAGIGIKIALDVGAHKRAAYSSVPLLEDEMYKRTFWALVRLGRSVSILLGRPCNIQEEDFDLEMPCCCDDEYLTRANGQEFAQQPIDKPSLMAYFNLSIKLSQIEGLAMRTIYASTKAKRHHGFKGEEWMTRTIAQLDSLLAQWSSSIPEHLRHDSTITNTTFKTQSLHLYLQYHELQIMLYRPILSSSSSAPIPHLPLAICLNSAHSLVRLTTSLYNLRKQKTCLHHLDTVFALACRTRPARRHWQRTPFDLKRAIAGIDSMQSVLHGLKDRWRWAPRFASLIQSLKVMGEVLDDELPQPCKRSYEDEAATSLDTAAEISAPVPSSIAPGIFDDMSWDEFSNLDERSAGMTQSDGAVLGSINFGALFGFGGPGLPDISAHAPSASPDGAFVAGAGLDGFGYGLESWTHPEFDWMSSDWQWTPPAGVGHLTGYSGAPGSEHGTSQ